MRLLYIAIITFGAWLPSCSPVKKVLNDPEKFEAVAKEVVRRGYCINDTTSRDTLIRTIVKDTLIHDTLQIPPLYQNSHTIIDTVFASGAHLSIDPQGQINLACPVKEIQHTATVNHYIRDRKKEQILQQDIDDRDDIINKLNLTKHSLVQQLSDKQNQIKELRDRIRTRTIQLVGLIILIGAYIGFKLYRKVRTILPL